MSELLPEFMDQRFASLATFSYLTDLANVSQTMAVVEPESYRLEIIDHHQAAGLDRLCEVATQCVVPARDISVRPFSVGIEEISELAKHFGAVFAGIDLNGQEATEAVREFTAARLVAATGGNLAQGEIAEVFRGHFLIPDLVSLASQTLPYNDPVRIERESRWIWDPMDKRLNKFIGPEVLRLLSMSRVLGLIPFEAIRRIRETKFRVLGASVAASTIDLLGALGAEDIMFVDGGLISPSGQGKMTGEMASFENNGLPKALLLMRQLQKRNPYGNYLGFPGRVLPAGAEKGSQDITFNELVSKADEIIEVVDDPLVKILYRFYAEKEHPNLPIGFIADVGSRPFAGREIPGLGNHFNQELSKEELVRMLKLSTISDRVEFIKEGSRAVYLMVDNNLPPEHRIQFILSCLGIVPYWSQTPISSKESAAIYAKLFIQRITGENTPIDKTPISLGTPLSDHQTRLIEQICKKVLGI